MTDRVIKRCRRYSPAGFLEVSCSPLREGNPEGSPSGGGTGGVPQLCQMSPKVWGTNRGFGKSRVTGLPDINMVGYSHYITDDS